MKKFNKGFSLVEVLVALFILSLGITGTLQLFIYGIAVSRQAIHKERITLFAASLVEAIRTNIEEADFETRWQEKIKEDLPGCELNIGKIKKGDQWTYTIIILPAGKGIQKLQIQVVI